MIAFDAIGLFDRGFGPYILPVSPPDGIASTFPKQPLTAKVMGKAPGRLTSSGWVPVSVHDLAQRCHDYQTAKLWQETWGANVGFVASDGFVFVDNDQGEDFSRTLRDVLVEAGVAPFRRFVQAPKHKRDAFLLRVLDFTGEPALVANQNLKFRKGTAVAEIQILAHGKQAVIAGTHPGTRCPYVWDCDIGNLSDDIPVVSDQRFSECIRKLLGELSAQGWALDGGGASGTAAARTPKGGVAIATSGVANTAPPDPAVAKAALDDARDLLSLLPNREVPPGVTPTKVDLYLDDYPNFVDVAYRLAGQLGRPVAELPEARDLWVDWATGRLQVKQSPEDIWRSVLNQPTLSYGDQALEKLVQDLGARPKPGFPPVDPNDPLLKASPTPLWDRMRDDWALFLPKSGFIYLPDGAFVPRQVFLDQHADNVPALAKELAPGLKKGRKPPNAVELFCSQPGKPVVTHLIYDPGTNPSSQLIPDPQWGNGHYAFNRWKPTEIQARAVPAVQIQPWLDHVEFILGSRAERDLFLKWCAYMVQFPQEKANWHYLLMSVSGLGKDTMLAPIRLAVGLRNIKELEAAQLSSQFNEPFETKLLVINELRQPVRVEGRMIWNSLKNAMAAPPDTLRINPKNMPVYYIPNRVAVILLANDYNPVSLDPGDRRLHVLNRRHSQPKDKSYYDKLRAWLDQGGKEDAAAYLLAYPLTAADKSLFKGRAPNTTDKDQLILMNTDPVEGTILDIMQEVRDGKRTPLTEMSSLIELLAAKGVRGVQSGQVRGCLLDMERRGKGAGRVRVNPNHPNNCGVINSKGTSARLWYLGPVPDGREWKDLGDLEVIAIWRGKSLPPSATVLNFPGTTQDAPQGEEPI